MLCLYACLMVLPFLRPRSSNSRGPDLSAKADTKAVLSGDKKTPTEADYKPASADSKKRCHECKSYTKFGEPESDCKQVIGVVKAEGVCDLFSQRDYSATGDSGQTVVVQVTHGL